MGPLGSSAPKMAAAAVRGILQLFKLLLLEICVSVCLQTVCSNVPPSILLMLLQLSYCLE